MKKQLIIPIMAAFMAGSTLTSCSREQKLENASENVSDAKEDLNEAERKYAEEWEKFKMESDEHIAANEREITRYREQGQKDKDFEKRYKARVDELEQRNAAMRDRRDNYNNDHKMKDNWQEFKREFNHDMDELGAALKDLTKDNAN